MTTPSNANTSGLAPCPFCGGAPFDRGFRRWECGSCGAQGPAGSKADATNGWNRRFTAASAQARIAELDEQLAQAAMMIIGATTRAAAAEARADRLTKALERIAHPEYGLGFNKLRGIARAALQQETQP